MTGSMWWPKIFPGVRPALRSRRISAEPFLSRTCASSFAKIAIQIDLSELGEARKDNGLSGGLQLSCRRAGSLSRRIGAGQMPRTETLLRVSLFTNYAGRPTFAGIPGQPAARDRAAYRPGTGRAVNWS